MNTAVFTQTAVGDDTSGEKPVMVKGTAGQNMTALPHGYSPGEHDVICGRGRKAFSHVGNERFRKLVESRLAEYSSASAKLEKSYILSDIVCEVRRRSPTGGFVKRDTTTGHWYEVGGTSNLYQCFLSRSLRSLDFSLDFLAREKTSQAFRDALHDQYKSSNTAKKKRRQQEQAEKYMLEQNSASSLSFHNSTSSLTFDHSSGFGMSKPPMVPINRYEPSQDSLLGALDVEISASLREKPNFVTSGQNSARSVVDFGPNPIPHRSMQQRGQQQQHQNDQPAWMNHSCPNFSWDHNVDSRRQCQITHQNMNRSAPHMMISDLDYGMTSSPNRAPCSEGDTMDVEASYSRQQQHQQMGDDSDSFGDDLILSPIGDGSPRRLFNSLSNLNNGYNGAGGLSVAPMLE